MMAVVVVPLPVYVKVTVRPVGVVEAVADKGKPV